MLKKLPLFISIGYTVALAVLCLITIDFDSIEEVAPSFSDKIFHFLSYAILTLLWYKALRYQFKTTPQKTLTYVSVGAIAFGIIVEVLQEVFTDTRVFDINDIVSNTLGVLITVTILLFKTKTEVKK